ncbi:UbiA family prenyltransferase [Agarilytica rhodophyticola]|uniref:UbiA family prenyltransferase n=1 Tax=Agarilytica rhodophyticola TaxID=1737490 RepID=UPI000B344F12|nr:UbiA family prenyltransferase [Agarilytica rhodophyticola]
MILVSDFRQLALLIRLPNSFTVIANIVAASLIGSQGHIDLTVFFILLLASLCFYHGGMVLNDCLDIAEDKLTQPHRPLVSGKISTSFAWILATVLMGVATLLPLLLSQAVFLVAVLLAISIVAYNFSPRESLFGCVLMGACRSLNWLLPLVAFGTWKEYAPYAFLVGIYVMSLTFLSRDENYADRRWLVVLSVSSLLLGGIYFLWAFDSESPFYWFKCAIVVAGLLLLFAKIMQLLKDYRPENIRAVVMFFIIGMIPLDACLVFVAGYYWQAIFLLALIIPSKLLARRLYVT